ncbi:GNAT family N-acetyltransferase [Janthinobacterium fluminis]|uniref:GNAT family N-acetyltransferase n=1 Tax=Janthinobacterium fluminis TaxID=2987524 RepID=A0ABT5K762_9BURK|nr:GNAT family N-acetyltransferase [Janthinobacterium fluminis]MDC8760485.1 GNAT family N-acetyltransferase [Janthinobacterium fluminis]
MPDHSIFLDFSIEPIAPADFDIFVTYLNDHLSDNGEPGNVYFQPLPYAESIFSSEKAKAFREALDVSVGAPGWRRLWGAFTPHRSLVGHIDLRAHPERCAAHRCLLGMGVDRNTRKFGLGQRLIEHAEKWALGSGAVEWIDLQVLSINEPAIRLYHRSGFTQTGEVPEMFRIDGQTFSFTSMSKRLVISSDDVV